MSVQNFSIRDHYHVVYQSSQIENPEEAKVFILGEGHPKMAISENMKRLCHRSRQLNAQLIQAYAEPHSILCVEGMNSYEDLELIMKNACIAGSKNMEIRCLYSSVLSELELDPLTQKRISKVYGWDLPSSYPVNQAFLSFLEKKGWQLRGCNKWQSIILALDEGYKQNYKHYMLAEQELRQSYHDTKLSKELSELLNESKENCVINSVLMDILVRDTFPLRTKNMANTVKLLKKEPLCIGQAFFIGGALHVQQKDAHPNYALDPLYEALEKAQGVALVPKILDNI